jgi:alpha-beta hydrolase superfamily lysophospholipase
MGGARIFAAGVVYAADAEVEGTKDEATLIEQANQAFWKRNFAQARKLVSQLASGGSHCPKASRTLVNLAICDAQLDDWTIARKEAEEGIARAKPGTMTEADGLGTLARCEVVERKIDKAKENYQRAIKIATHHLGDWNCDLAPLYEGLGACYLADKQLAPALAAYKKVAQLDYLKYGGDDTHLAWSFLSIGSVLRQLGDQALAKQLYKKVFWNFRYQNEQRIMQEMNPSPSEKEQLQRELRRQVYGFTDAYEDRNQGLDYIKADIPEDVLANPVSRPRDFDNWFKRRVGRDAAPGLAFFDPRQKLRALIVTVHGLGLYRGAFTPFAEQVQHEGFGVISFDVRGFGSYRNDEVYQRADFNAIIGDLQRILTALRGDYPGLPIILLGESMGGAIALRIAAVSPELVDGVVSSVPSGSRYQAKSTSLSVGVKLLKNRNKQFDIGRKIVDQATQDPELRVAWEDNPETRMKLSPAELLEFQRFMNENSKYAEQIKTTPVIIFQGYSDQLVKPLSTLALYQAMPVKDKDLVFVGKAEHLIFEEGQFDQDVVDGLSGWINRHIDKSKYRAEIQTPKG